MTDADAYDADADATKKNATKKDATKKDATKKDATEKDATKKDATHKKATHRTILHKIGVTIFLAIFRFFSFSNIPPKRWEPGSLVPTFFNYCPCIRKTPLLEWFST